MHVELPVINLTAVEIFPLGLMDKQLDKKHGTFFLYMIITARLLYARRIKRLAMGMVKFMELTEMAKLANLVKEKILFRFVSNLEITIGRNQNKCCIIWGKGFRIRIVSRYRNTV